MKSSQIDNLKLEIERTDLRDLFKTLSFLEKNFKIQLENFFNYHPLFSTFFLKEFLIVREAEIWRIRVDFEGSCRCQIESKNGFDHYNLP